jgi:molecular chaperone DnaK
VPLGSQLAAADDALSTTKDVLGDKSGPVVATLARRLERQRLLLSNSSDAEARRAAAEEARHIQQELARLRDAPENRREVMLRDLALVEDGFAELIDQLDAATAERITQLGYSAREAIGHEDWNKSRQIIEHMRSTLHNILYRQPAFIVSVFTDLAQERFAALDKDLHEEIVARGVAAIEADDINAVRSAVIELLNNRMPNQMGAKNVAVLAGLIR